MKKIDKFFFLALADVFEQNEKKNKTTAVYRVPFSRLGAVLVVVYRIVMKEKWKILLCIGGFGWAFMLNVFRERRVIEACGILASQIWAFQCTPRVLYKELE